MRRRDLLAGLGGVVGLGGAGAVGQTEGGKSATVLSGSKVFPFAGMPVKKMANGGESRDVVRGMLPTGEAVAVHGSMQPAGAVPNPPHVIQHSEIMMVEEGTLEVMFDGRSQRIGPGGVFFVAYGTEHQVRNVGDGPVKYVIVAIGGEVKKWLG